MPKKPQAEQEQKEQEGEGMIRAFRALAVLILAGVVGFFVYSTTVNPESDHPFKLGLDLAGGSHLIYEADVSNLSEEEIPELMSVLRDVIERRVNIFGVSEPIVQVEQSSFAAEEESHRLVVELPGVTDVDEAVAEIGRTPLLEFKLVDQEALAAQQSLEQFQEQATSGGENIDDTTVNSESATATPYVTTGLTGRYLERAELVFGSQSGGGLSNEPIVRVEFNDEGGQLFEDITTNNVGESLAIFLDGEVISQPRINEPIAGGSAIISGGFTPDEARDLVQNLNFGALPVPIELESTQTIGASLGAGILERGIQAGIIGLSVVIAFMVLWYRLPGVIAGIALLFYIASMLALFKLIPVTLTAAGLAGFILSVGMAVDANVLIFERMKEEYLGGKNSREAARIGFQRAWAAIRDGNVTSILSAVILFWFGTSIVKGFALVFGLGVLISMITAIVFTRTLLMALPGERLSEGTIFAKLYKTGISRSTE